MNLKSKGVGGSTEKGVGLPRTDPAQREGAGTLCIKNDEFCMKHDEFALKMMDFVLITMDVYLMNSVSVRNAR